MKPGKDMLNREQPASPNLHSLSSESASRGPTGPALSVHLMLPDVLGNLGQTLGVTHWAGSELSCRVAGSPPLSGAESMNLIILRAEQGDITKLEVRLILFRFCPFPLSPACPWPLQLCPRSHPAPHRDQRLSSLQDPSRCTLPPSSCTDSPISLCPVFFSQNPPSVPISFCLRHPWLFSLLPQHSGSDPYQGFPYLSCSPCSMWSRA